MPDGSERSYMQNVTPGPDSTRAFRDALGRFATGVCVMTTGVPAGRLIVSPDGIWMASTARARVMSSLVMGGWLIGEFVDWEIC